MSCDACCASRPHCLARRIKQADQCLVFTRLTCRRSALSCWTSWSSSRSRSVPKKSKRASSGTHIYCLCLSCISRSQVCCTAAYSLAFVACSFPIQDAKCGRSNNMSLRCSLRSCPRLRLHFTLCSNMHLLTRSFKKHASHTLPHYISPIKTLHVTTHCMQGSDCCNCAGQGPD